MAGTAADTLSWATTNRTQLVVGAVVLALALAAGLGAWFYRQQQTDKANLAFSHAVRVYQEQVRPSGMPATPGVETFGSVSERAQAARREFSDIASKYPHTSPGHMAAYFVGMTFRDEGKYADAEKQFKSEADSSNKDVSALARYALAQLYLATNRPADAIKMYKDLVDHPAGTVTKPEAQIELAAIYQQQNQPQEAVRLLEQVKTENPNTPAADAAQQKLAELNKGAATAPSPLAK